MVDRRAEAEQLPGAAEDGERPSPSAADDHERILLLECRVEQMRSAVEAARADADRARAQLAESAAREAEHARRCSVLEEELAGARADLLALHRRLDRSDALRAELEGHLLDAGSRADAEELMRLRQALLVGRQKARLQDGALEHLRARVEQLVSSRETLLTRIAEWQRLVRDDGPEAADLAEFMAELRGEILDLEQQRILGDGREAALRDRLAGAGVDPDAHPGVEDRVAQPGVDRDAHRVDLHGPALARERIAERPGEGRSDVGEAVSRERTAGSLDPARPDFGARLADEAVRGSAEGRLRAARRLVSLRGAAASAPLAAALAAADEPSLRAELLILLGRSGDPEALDAVRSWTGTTDPTVRAAAYEALGRLLERRPDALVPYLRAGLSDGDPRVRRRVVLAAATAREIALRPLLEPIRDDPDPQVRRVVREVLRRTPPGDGNSEDRTDAVLALTVASARAPS